MTNDTKSRLTEAEHDEMVAAVKSWLPASYGPLVTTLGEWAERLVAEHGCEASEAALAEAERRKQKDDAELALAWRMCGDAQAELGALMQRIQDLIATAEYRRKSFGLVHLHPSAITPGNLRALLDGES